MGVLQLSAICIIFACLVCILGTTVLAEQEGLQKNIGGIQTILPDPPYVEGSILVQAAKSPDGSVQSLSDIHAAIGASIERDYNNAGIPGLSLVRLPEGMKVPDAITYYTSVPGVAYAEPDYYAIVLQTPDDPEFWRQWGLSNTGSPFKENTTPGIPGADISATSAWDDTTDTNGIIIAVIDTGVDIGHPDLVDNIWSYTGSGTLLHGINIIEEKTVEPWDDFGHGTHCAGIIGMVGNNGLGGAGVAWNTTILPIKVMDYQGHGKLSDIALGMAYATLYNASVVSCSFGTEYSRVMEDIIRQSPALFVCAAGNFEVDLNIYPQYPSCFNFSNLITIAATDAQDTMSWFSNYGNRTVHVGAPGSDIYSTIPSVYSYTPVFSDPEFSEQNFSITGDWTLESGSMPGELPYIHVVIPEFSESNSLVIELIQPVYIPDETVDAAHLVWDTKGDFKGYQVIEYSYDRKVWTPLLDSNKKFTKDDWKQDFHQLTSVETDSSVFVRFTYYHDDDSRADYAIRNIRIGFRGGVLEPKYKYMDGTSMATPMVAGIAGLIKGKKPDLSAGEVKQVIMDTADPLPSLRDTTITGRRVNLSAALKSLKKTDAIPLSSGWNHVSVPRQPAPGYDTAQIFSGVNSSGHSILVYVNSTTGYRTLAIHDPVVPLQGYWVYSTGALDVPVRFSEQITPLSREIQTGWSSVGGWAETNLSANETFHTLMTAWSYAVGYDADTQLYEEPIIRGGTGNQSDARPIHPYGGYWLYCSQNGTYQNGFG